MLAFTLRAVIFCKNTSKVATKKPVLILEKPRKFIFSKSRFITKKNAALCCCIHEFEELRTRGKVEEKASSR